MITNYNLLFYLKKPKKYESGPMPIYMRITVNGVSKETPFSRKCVQIAGAQNLTDAYYLFKLSGIYKF
jgi:hypothetical protein